MGGAAGGTCAGVGSSGLECEPASKTEVCSSISHLTGLRRAVQGGHEAHVTGSSFCHLHEPHTEHAGSWPEGCGSPRLEHDCWCPRCGCCSHRSLVGPPQCLCVPDLQGCFLSSANVCVVKVEGTPHLCKTDEVGEICVDSSATATAYYGLLGITKNVFEVPAGPTAVAGGRARCEGVWPSSGCLQP